MGEEAAGVQELRQQLVVRQPVFDREKSVCGYRFVINDVGVNGDTPTQCNDAQLVAEQVAYMSACSVGGLIGKKIFLSIQGEHPIDRSILPENMDDCIIAMVGKAANISQCLHLADTIGEEGGVLAVDCDVEPDVLASLLGRCSMLTVSMTGKNPAEIVALRRKFKNYEGMLLAANIEDWETYEGARALGFKYFHGSFFGVPESAKVDGLRSVSVAKLQLLGELNNPECGIDDLSSIIASDISMSYRILRYINSSSFGFRTQIKSIQQAVALLGLKELKHWATVVAMTDLDSTPKGEEVAYTALHRARFLSRFAVLTDGVKLSSDCLFMLGLFSKLDALLSFPMEKALEDIPLDEDVRAGLCGEANECQRLISMMESVESGNCKAASGILRRYDANCAEMAAEYMKAAKWTAQQLSDMHN
ncbi:EAL and HDOD domain-containing protein [uncultured Pseudodesulfovibrio sp.]|uniref:EAL and HDOD domain-containing protein n=1 Tax=uncultured Pseudodesulfovibrio sp. TaxID=2035858 RepID=UPI003748F334